MATIMIVATVALITYAPRDQFHLIRLMLATRSKISRRCCAFRTRPINFVPSPIQILHSTEKEILLDLFIDIYIHLRTPILLLAVVRSKDSFHGALY